MVLSRLCILFLCLCLSVNSWKIALTNSNYDNVAQSTYFIYGLTEPLSIPCEDIVIAVPSCSELNFEDISPSKTESFPSQSGIKWSGAQPSDLQIILKVSGFVKSGALDYSLQVNGNTVSGKVNGPICESVRVLTCDAGQDRSASCGGRVVLSGQNSKYATQYKWSTTEPGVQIHQPNSVVPTLLLPTSSMCSRTVMVSLTVEGPEFQQLSCVTYVKVEDIEPPILSGLYANDITVECDDIPAASLVTARDNCSPSLQVVFSEVSNDATDNNRRTITRSWIAEDECGNSVSHVQIIAIIDNVAPSLVGVPDDETYSCDDIPEPCEVNAYDNCDTSLTVQETEMKVPSICDFSYKIIRTWTAVDSSGMQAAKTQTISIVDIEPPRLIGVPEDFSIQCGSIPDSPDIIAVDNCDVGLVVSMQQDRIERSEPPNPFFYLIVLSYSAVDQCGNLGEKSWTITIDDDTSPIMYGVDSDKIVACDSVPPPCEVMVSDNCDTSLTVVFTELTLQGSCSNTYDLIRSWTAVDTNGNGVDEHQTLQVIDTAEPKFTNSIPSEVFAGCDFIPVNVIDAIDVCGEVTVEKTTVVVDGPYPVQYTLIHTWLATDECGLTSTNKQTIHVGDDAPPIMSGLPPMYISESCSSSIDKPSVVVSDNCPDCKVNLDFDEITHDGTCAHEYTIERTWIATDCAGQSVSFVQSLSIHDSEPPQLTGLSGHLTIPFGNIPDASIITATDNCDSDVSTREEESTIPGSCLYEFLVVRRWTAEDDCGNTASHTQTVNVIHTENPTFTSNPNDLDAACDNIPLPSINAIDNIGEIVEVETHETILEGTCKDSYKLIRDFIAIDSCGNRGYQHQTITVYDSEAPHWDLSNYDPFVSLQDTFVPPDPKEATDSCDFDVSVVSTEETIPSNCPTEYYVIFTWDAEDRCGNKAESLITTINVYDQTAPIFDGLPDGDVTVSCDAIPPHPDVTAADTDGTETIVQLTQDTIISCSNTYSLINTWRTEDCSHNYQTFTQTMSIVDNNPPQLSEAPLDVTASCQGIPEGSVDDIVATDNCATLNVDFSEVKIYPNGNSESNPHSDYILVRTWKTSDGCNEQVSIEQLVSVEDSVKPTVGGISADDIVHDCFSPIPEPATGYCSDDCADDKWVPIYDETIKNMDPCVNNVVQIIIRSWTCQDLSGNVQIKTQSLTVIDTEPPSFSILPNDQIIPCDSEIETLQPITVLDDCDGFRETNAASSMNSKTIPGSNINEYTVIYEWTATDACGSTSTQEQSIQVVDKEPPTLTVPTNSETVSCKLGVIAPEVSVEDNCDSNPFVSSTSQKIGGTCEDRYVTVHSWISTDASGNEGSESQMVQTVDDISPPTFTPPEANIWISYTSVTLYPKLNLVLTDDCDPSPTANCQREKIKSDCLNQYTLIDTCLISDRCKNNVSISRTIHVLDDVPPQIGSVVPEDKIYDCTQNIPTPQQLISEIGVNVNYSVSTISQSCAQSYILERVWIAQDCANNRATWAQTITVQDVTPPVLSQIPNDVTKECKFSLMLDEYVVTATDACDSDVPVVSSVRNWEEDGVVMKYEITFIATDDCSNTVQKSFTITVLDTEPPIIRSLPPQMPSSNPYNPLSVPSVPSGVSCDDSCVHPEISFEVETIDGSCIYEYRVFRTWSCSDEQGNTISETRTVYVDDSTPPVLGPTPLPVDINIDHKSVTIPRTLTATDDVDNVIPVSYSQVKMSLPNNEDDPNNYYLIRTWTAVDKCGNGVEHVQSIRVFEAMEPIIPNTPPHATVECDSIPNDDVEITDSIRTLVANGEVEITLQKTTAPGSCPNQFTIIRTWQASDLAGNTISDFQSIDVVDISPPSFNESPLPLRSVTVECDDIPEVEVLTANDNCGSATVTFSENIVDNEQILGATIATRHWIATDLCGNTHTHTSVLSIEDTIPPDFVAAPPDASFTEVPCSLIDDDSALWANDNCDGDSVPYSCTSHWDVTNCASIRTTTCETADLSGNQKIYVYTHTFNDVHPPTFLDPPSDSSIDCLNDLPPAPTVIVEEPCIDQYEVNPATKWITIGGKSRVIRTWSATDKCGHVNHIYQTITLEDNEAPTFLSTPTDTTLSCFPTPNTDTYSTAPDVSDDCIVSDVSTSIIRTDGACLFNYTIGITWIATDDYGHTSSISKNIVVTDTEAPVLVNLPSDDHRIIEVACNLVPEAPSVDVVDNCDPYADVVYKEKKIETNLENVEYILERSWVATDVCENVYSFNQQLHILMDTTAPVISNIPNNIETNCEGPFLSEEPSATDNCDSNINLETITTQVDGDCPNDYTLITKWIATDSSGLSSSASQTVTVTDNTPPTWVGAVPHDQVVSCSNIPLLSDISSLDQCGQESSSTSSFFKIENPNSANFDIINTWVATDSCGNSRTSHQTLYVIDEIPPSFDQTPPSDITIPCKDPIPEIPVMTASDACDTNIDVEVSTVRNSYECSDVFDLVVSWSATDESGNTQAIEWRINFEDSEAPTFDAIELEQVIDITTECNLPSPIDLNVNDNCNSNLNLQVMDTSIIDSVSLNEHSKILDVYVRHYWAVDRCENRVDYYQTITLEDTTPPTLSAIPEDISVPCSDGELSLFDDHTVLAHDSCSSVSIHMTTEVYPGTCSTEYEKRYHYIGTDEVGNQVNDISVAIVYDKTPPVLENIPQWSGTTFECNALPTIKETEVVNAKDFCDGIQDVNFNTWSSDNNGKEFNYLLYYVWSATDDCGNSISETTTVEVADSMAPELKCEHCSDVTVECNGIPNIPSPQVSDNCDNSVQIDYKELIIPGSCDSTYIITRTWSSTDTTGNTNSVQQNVTVVNRVPPELVFDNDNLPVSKQVSCSNIPPMAIATGHHHCGEDVNVVSEEVTSPGSCPNEYILTRKWSIADCSGGAADHSQVITVKDQEAPILSAYPTNVEAQIHELKSTWPGKLSANDNCDVDILVKFTQSKELGSCKHSFLLIRSWISEDLCGNINNHIQTVFVVDSTPPILNGIPQNSFIEYDELSNLGEASIDGVSATDNSKSSSSIVVVEKIESGSCASQYVIARTWTATDNCGNSAKEDQTINVVDNTPPIINTPDDETVECDAVPIACDVQVDVPNSHPDYDLEVSHDEITLMGDHSNEYRLIRSWWVEDCAQNKATHVQTILVQDTTPPVLSRIYLDETLQCDCDTSREAFVVDALDNCDDVRDVSLNVERENGKSEDFYIVYRSWTSSDNSGNVVSQTQTVTVIDNVAPEWCDDLPETHIFVQCDNVPAPPELKALDECDPAVNVVYQETTELGGCDHDYILIRQWVAADRNGNQISHSSTIQVEDSLTPTLLNVQEKLCLWPANGMIAVYTHASESLIDVVDNCGQVNSIFKSCNSSEVDTSETDCNYDASNDVLYVRVEQSGFGREYRIYSSNTDGCGNTKNGYKIIWIPPSQEKFDAAINNDECSGTGAENFISSMPK